MYWATLPEGVWNDAKNNKQRPVVIVSNDTNNQFSNSILVVPCTSNGEKTDLPTHYTTKLYSEGPTVILCENVTNILKTALTGFIGMLEPEDMKVVDKALQIALGLKEHPKEEQPQMLIKEDGKLTPSNSSEDQKSDEKKHSTATLSADYKKQYINDYEQFGVDYVVTKYKVASRVAAYQRVAYYKQCLKNSK
jgi:mRNA-degrading endonuclease toxin of MazEF toxin-antitoxin module